METEAEPNASPKTPSTEIEVYYASRNRFGDKFTEIDSEGYFQKIYPSIAEVVLNWKRVPTFAIYDMIDDISEIGFLQAPHQEILSTIFHLMNDYDTNILADYDNDDMKKMGCLQSWVQENNTHTSMSVNDVISIDGTFYMVDDIGWYPLATTPSMGKKIGPISR